MDMEYLATGEPIITFKCGSKVYDAEESGIKSNTVRILTSTERTLMFKDEPQRIKIKDEVVDRSFMRELTDIRFLDTFMNHHLYVFSWKHEPEKESNKDFYIKEV